METAVVQEAQLPREVYKETLGDIAVLKQSLSRIAQTKNRQ